MNSHSRKQQGIEFLENLKLDEFLKRHMHGDQMPVNELASLLPDEKLEPIDLKKYQLDYQDHGPGRRVSPRYGVSMTVLICNHYKAFRSKTENLSLTGCLIQDALPTSFCKDVFDVVLIDESQGTKRYFLFRGKAVTTKPPSRRVVFEAVGQIAQKQLMSLVSDLTPLCI